MSGAAFNRSMDLFVERFQTRLPRRIDVDIVQAIEVNEVGLGVSPCPPTCWSRTSAKALEQRLESPWILSSCIPGR